MSAAPASCGPVSRRARMLRALGVTPWVRRAAAAAAQPAASPEVNPAVAPASCIVVLPDGCAPRELDLLGRALAAYGPELARAGRILVKDGQPAVAVPPVRAYLVFGQAQAHALGRELPAAVMNQAQIVLADEPPQVLAHGTGKRRLWTALRQLRRALAVPGGA
ncbi:hypothetical protein [Frateuria sp. STR12]|uniref:hypothetical protein n=1 Tax=Frateuria hangzhouensis TaxID=2995589 RepID=UPI002260FDF7|nr:hypothetical protein [Frateuria sp. STR12]MCX7513804.1 hypothetical protein [Frateuria sp. STR12]